MRVFLAILLLGWGAAVYADDFPFPSSFYIDSSVPTVPIKRGVLYDVTAVVPDIKRFGDEPYGTPLNAKVAKQFGERVSAIFQVKNPVTYGKDRQLMYLINPKYHGIVNCARYQNDSYNINTVCFIDYDTNYIGDEATIVLNPGMLYSNDFCVADFFEVGQTQQKLSNGTYCEQNFDSPYSLLREQ